jgi:predicted nucleic acid-binding protein
MLRTIISDTSCLILLDEIGEIEILHKLFGTIITTSEVAKEFGQPLAAWFKIQQPGDKKYQSIIETSVDEGEASVIALAIELDDCLLIIDDLKRNQYFQTCLKVTNPTMI